MNDATRTKIKNADPGLLAELDCRHGYIHEKMIDRLIKIDRLMLVLVRCGNGRFLCPIQDLNHFTNIIGQHASMSPPNSTETDYVRDVSFPV